MRVNRFFSGKMFIKRDVLVSTTEQSVEQLKVCGRNAGEIPVEGLERGFRPQAIPSQKVSNLYDSDWQYKIYRTT